MTASTVSSSVITNRKANPPTYNDLGAAGDAKLRAAQGTVAVATTSIDEQNDVILLCPVKGDDRIVSIKLFNDDLDSNGSPALAVDVGLYKDVSADGTSATEVDVDAYASAITTLQAANTTGVEVAFEARNITSVGNTVAEDGGESQHSEERVIGLKVTTAAATAAAGDISWVVTLASA